MRITCQRIAVLIVVCGLSTCLAEGQQGEEKKGGTEEVKAIPEEFQKTAEALFAAGQKIFIWDAEAPVPLEVPSFMPVAFRRIGYAFANDVEPFAFKVRVLFPVRDKQGGVTQIYLLNPGPDVPKRIGGVSILIAAADRIVKGKGNIVITLVPNKTQEPSDPKAQVLSNEVLVPVKVAE